jgi:gamma-glutamylcyclotransferase (GGCT)/AIG2-like uncharacterized protein YtfP
MNTPGGRFVRRPTTCAASPATHPRDHSIHDPSGLTLFVYGTLMRRGHYHAELFPDSPPTHAARTPGRLFHLSAGYPAVTLPDSLQLATASGNLELDSRTEREWRAPVARFVEPASTQDWVHGEVITVTDALRMRRLDELEGFRPGGRSLFLRLLVPVWIDLEPAPRPAWIYVQKSPRGRQIPSGRWSA